MKKLHDRIVVVIIEIDVIVLFILAFGGVFLFVLANFLDACVAISVERVISARYDVEFIVSYHGKTSKSVVGLSEIARCENIEKVVGYCI